MSSINLINTLFKHSYDDKESSVAHSILMSGKEDDKKNISVPLDSIHPCQPSIGGDRVIQYIVAKKDNEKIEPPIGIKVGNDVYICDGHHRTAAALLLDEEDITVRVLPITKKYWDTALRAVGKSNIKTEKVKEASPMPLCTINNNIRNRFPASYIAYMSKHHPEIFGSNDKDRNR